MNPVQAVQFSAAGDARQLTIDADCILIGCALAVVASGSAVISRDPSTTIANAVTAPSNVIDDNIIAVLRQSMFVQLALPISAGQGVFVSASAAMSVVLYFEVGS